MLVLGLSGNFSPEDVDLVPSLPDYYFHDASACLVKDGVLVAAVEEERFNRIKKTNKFPANSVRACLDTAGVAPGEIDLVGHYFSQNFVDNGLNELYVDHPTAELKYSRQLIREMLGDAVDWAPAEDRIVYSRHHIAHATSCFVRSGMSEALVLVMDGRGEEESGTLFRAAPGELEIIGSYDLMKSLGALYEFAIQLLGYRFGDEYKVMGLAPYGDPRTYRELFDGFYTLDEKGDYQIHPLVVGIHPVSPTFFNAGFLPRRKGEPFSQQHKDFAAGLQEMLEKIVMHVVTHAAQSTGLPNFCFVGGVAHNSTLNGTLLKSGLFEEMFVHPASHDAGAAEGAALEAAYRTGAKPYRLPRLRSASVGPDLGPPDEVERVLRSWSGVVAIERVPDIVERSAELLANGAVMAWARGGSEYGPRALGNRSIIADARPKENQDRINTMVKKRESYRPFAPVVTAEAADRYFDLPATRANYDFMSYVVDVRENHREELGAVTHVDGSARLQVIDKVSDERFHRLVERFGELTGTPVLLNTSFNNSSEPIVQTIDDAVTCFLTTDLDHLVVEDFLVSRRPDADAAVDDLVVRFRPSTRLARRTRLTPAGEREVGHDIYLDYSVGTSATVSAQLFEVLDRTDGSRTVGESAGEGGLTDELRAELHELWRARFFTLGPSRA